MNIFEAVGRIVSASTDVIVRFVEATTHYVGIYEAIGKGGEELTKSTIAQMTTESDNKLAELRREGVEATQ